MMLWNVFETAQARMTRQTAGSGTPEDTRKGETETRTADIVLTWIPGIVPVTIPRSQPARRHRIKQKKDTEKEETDRPGPAENNS